MIKNLINKKKRKKMIKSKVFLQGLDNFLTNLKVYNKKRMMNKMILKKVIQLSRQMKNPKGKMDNHLKANQLLLFNQNRSCLKKAQKKFQLSKKALENKVLVLKHLLRRGRRFMTRLYLKPCLINFLTMIMSMLIISLKTNLIINPMKICKFRVFKLLDCSSRQASFIHIISQHCRD